MKELFLVCALALSPVNFHSSPNPDLVHEIQQIKEFIHKVHPGAEVWISPEEQKPTDPHWERIPFEWNGMGIWIKRHHIYDHRKTFARMA